MAELYSWFVVAHLVGLVLFAVCHGVSVFMAFRIRGERDPAVVASILSFSQTAITPMYLGLALILIGGVGAAWGANLWFEPWIIASVVVLIVVLGVMYSVATPFYMKVRESLAVVGEDGRPSIEPAALVAQLDNRRPEILVVAGSAGLVILVWLMVAKPG